MSRFTSWVTRALRARLPITPSRWLLLALAIAVVMAVIGWVDTVTGLRPDITILYLLPIVATAYIYGLWKALGVSLIAGLAEILAHPVGPGESHAEVIADTLTHLAVFVLAAVAVDILLRQLDVVRALERRRDMDLAVARTVHEEFLGTHITKHGDLTIGARLGFASELGGDYYHVSDTPLGLFVSIGDISGKGIAAALFTATLHEEMVRALADDPSPASVIRALNDKLYRVTPPQMFVTLFCAVIGEESLTYANAGHEPPMLLLPGRTRPLLLECDSTVPLAVRPDLRPPSEVAPFPRGAVLLAVTDGVTESLALGPDARELVTELLARRRDLPPQQLADAVFAAAAPVPSAPQRDDITVLCIKRSF